ncbi:MAG: anthranilate phosphoribosyltransferase [Bdellovibrionales bacterium]|jgi:anthranilate phosphoribosyltransferase
MTLATALGQITLGQDLPAEEARAVFDQIFSGEVAESDIAALLVALRSKGEAVSELHGAVASMCAHMKALDAPEGAIDIVGTGGDGHGTLNVSTAAALVVAGAGVVVAKHGNRAASSQSGSSDVLGELGVTLDPPWEVLERAVHDIGLVFLYAPRHHPAMSYVAPVRRKLGVRTIFNLLGPLTNPAQVRRHLIGVFNQAWSQPMAQTLAAMGSETAWITHGADGLDEISITGLTHVTALEGGTLRDFDLSPREAGVPLASLSEIQGGDAKANAAAIHRLLAGETGAYRDIVLMNAGAALVIAEKAKDIQTGVVLAAASIDSGSAKDKLAQLVRMTSGG